MRMKRSLMLAAGLQVCAIASGQELFLDPSGEERITGGFLTTRGEIPPHEIQAKVRFDAKNLYVTVFSELDAGNHPRAISIKDDDPSMFNGDVAEIFLAPNPDSGVYYHFAVNPNGALYTAKQRDMSWTPPVSRKIHSTDTGWSAELEIPLATFGKTPIPGAVWGANFASTHSNPDRYSASWSGSSNYHDTKQLGKLIFGPGKDGKKTVFPFNIERIRLRDGILSGAMSLSEPLSFTRFRVQTFLDGKKDASLQCIKGENIVYSWEHHLAADYQPLKSSHIFELRITNVQDERILFQKKMLANSATGLNLHLDRFYYTHADETIRYSHDFPAPAQITLSRNGKICRTIRDAEKQGAISLAEPRLAPGQYVMEISSGNLRTSRIFLLSDEPPALDPIDSEAELNIADGAFLLGNRSVFLIGASSTEKSFLHFGDAFTVNYGNYGVQKNAVAVAGIPGYRLTRIPATGYVFPPEAEFKRLVSNFLAQNKPGKRGFTRIAYEAQMNVYEENGKAPLVEKNPSVYYGMLYRYLKEKAPDRLFSIHIDQHDCLREFAASCDIFETSYWSSSFATNMIPNLERDMTEAKKAAGNKPVIFWLGGTIPNASCRTAEELRAGVYLAILHDMAGVIFHMGHGYLPENRSRLWSLISGISSEIQKIYPEFKQGETLPDFVLASSQNLAYAAKKRGNRIMVITINLSGGENRFSLKTKAGDICGVLTPYEPQIRYLEN